MSQGLKPSVCIDAVLGKSSIDEALSIVSAAGIPAFEFWGWWDKDLETIHAAKERHNLEISACCTKFISLVDPNTRNDYLKGLEESIAIAKDLGCPTLISQVGDAIPGVDRQTQHHCLVEGLREATALLKDSEVTLVIEPLNELVDHAGYYLIRSDEAFEIIDEVNNDTIKVVFDIYHQQISEGHLIHNLSSSIDRIAHFHAAGNPGRHELTRGEIHYPSIFEAIQKTDYNGYVGLEYWPVDDAISGLKEVAAWF
jgi:hydroxypyruvate isomerase